MSKSHEFRKDDPIYFKCALRGLIQEAKENGITVDVESRNGVSKVMFKADNGECAGVVIE